MADRILTFSIADPFGSSKQMLPAYFLEAECEVKAVRIHTGTAPLTEELEFDIYDDGVSIMNDNEYLYATYRADTANYSGSTTLHLGIGETDNEMVEDFNNNIISPGSWITCQCIKGGGAKDITVQLEIDIISESDEKLV